MISFSLLHAAPPSVKKWELLEMLLKEGISSKELVGRYVGGREGPSKFEWFRLNSDTTRLAFRNCVGSM